MGRRTKRLVQAPEEFLGVVRNLQRTSKALDGGGSEEVLSSRVELSNPEGEITGYQPIEIRGQLLFGDVADGDHVRFEKPSGGRNWVGWIYDVTTNSYVSANWPFELVRGGTGSKEIRGVVRNLRRTVQTAPKAMPGQGAPTSSIQVLLFRVEISDTEGQIQRYVQVDMRGARIHGELADGDRVRFADGGNGLYRIDRVYSETTSSIITVEKYKPGGKVNLFLSIIFLPVLGLIGTFVTGATLVLGPVAAIPAFIFFMLVVAVSYFVWKGIRTLRAVRKWN